MPPLLFDQIEDSWDIAALDVPLLRQAHDYWQSKRVGDALPLRSAIEPTEIPLLLPHLFLIEVLQRAAPMRFRIRLIGTAFRRFFRIDLTGLEVSEDAVGPDGARFCADWREVLERRAPRWARIRQQATEAPVGQAGITAIRFSGLVLPLSRDGTEADMLLGATVYDPVD
jgi:hypothetical protein